MATLAWLKEWWDKDSTVKHRMYGIAHHYFTHEGPKLPCAERFPPILVTVNYGQLGYNQEADAVEKARTYLFPDARLVHIDATDGLIERFNPQGGLLFGNGTQSLLKGRNIGLAMEAIARVGVDVRGVIFCFTSEDDVVMPRDTGRNFVESLDSVLIASHLAGGAYAPLALLDKKMALRHARQWWPELFNVAFSCWAPVYGKPCGECRHCQRFTMFEEATR